jgi:Fe2+ or Zn2+ uptake regulation protein
MKSPEELAALFSSRGLKVTPQRQCIFEVLSADEGHPSAEAVYGEVHRRMPMMSLKTVYQTLNDLAEMGELQQLDLGTGSARFDPNIENHHHLVCSICGEVRDFYAEVRIADLSEPVRQGFVIDRTEVVLRGVCARCRVGQDQQSESET